MPSGFLSLADQHSLPLLGPCVKRRGPPGIRRRKGNFTPTHPAGLYQHDHPTCVDTPHATLRESRTVHHQNPRSRVSQPEGLSPPRPGSTRRRPRSAVHEAYRHLPGACAGRPPPGRRGAALSGECQPTRDDPLTQPTTQPLVGITARKPDEVTFRLGTARKGKGGMSSQAVDPRSSPEDHYRRLTVSERSETTRRPSTN